MLFDISRDETRIVQQDATRIVAQVQNTRRVCMPVSLFSFYHPQRYQNNNIMTRPESPHPSSSSLTVSSGSSSSASNQHGFRFRLWPFARAHTSASTKPKKTTRPTKHAKSSSKKKQMKKKSASPKSISTKNQKTFQHSISNGSYQYYR